MQYRTLGRTGVQVSTLSFGTMSFGGDADEETSGAMYRRCREAGINFFDTADIYTGGRSEEILGRLIAPERDEIVLASKVYWPSGPGVNQRGLSRRYIMRSVEGSLRRLGTDRIDLYYCHGYDVHTDMEEPLRALSDLTAQGKILYLGVSNWAAWQMAKALGISERRGWPRFECVQPQYSLVKRQAEVEILPFAQSEGLSVAPYSPNAAGLLTGKYGTTARPEHGRLQDNKMYTQRFGDPVYYEVAEKFTAHARERGVQPAALAVAWVMSHPAMTSPIIGARNVEQLEGSLGALGIQMTPEWRAEISALSPAPPVPTDRREEQQGFVVQPPR